jgi:hypothetical protein
MRPELRPVLVLVLLAALVAAALPAAAAPSRAGAPAAQAASAGTGLSLADRLWTWIGTFWPAAGRAPAPAPSPAVSPATGGLRPAGGCIIDPDGRCVPLRLAPR